MTKALSNGGSQRFGDHMLAFGLVRFTNGSTGMGERSLWRFNVARTCMARDPLVEVDASLPMLREMQRWIERAIETLQTDGGRIKQDQAPTK